MGNQNAEDDDEHWDEVVYAIEELFVVYGPKERDKLRNEVIDDIDGWGNPDQMEKVKFLLEAVFSNLEHSDGKIEQLRWLSDRCDLLLKLQELTRPQET